MYFSTKNSPSLLSFSISTATVGFLQCFPDFLLQFLAHFTIEMLSLCSSISCLAIAIVISFICVFVECGSICLRHQYLPSARQQSSFNNQCVVPLRAVLKQTVVMFHFLYYLHFRLHFLCIVLHPRIISTYKLHFPSNTISHDRARSSQRRGCIRNDESMNPVERIFHN